MNTHTTKSKPTIILLHGAFQDGPSTWRKVRPQLEAEGYKVVVITLPGRAGDGIDPKSLSTEIYRDAVRDVVLAESESVVLVGHSFGGITISNVAEAIPTKIKALVYLSAYLPQDGESMMDLALSDKDSHLGKPGNLVLAPDYSLASIKEDQKADIFANDATGADRDAIVSSLSSEAGAPQGMPVKLTEANFGHVPKFYLETTRDQCVSRQLQEKMISRAKLVKVIKIDAGHASYITQPEQVTEGILEAARF